MSSYIIFPSFNPLEDFIYVTAFSSAFLIPILLHHVYQPLLHQFLTNTHHIGRYSILFLILLSLFHLIIANILFFRYWWAVWPFLERLSGIHEWYTESLSRAAGVVILMGVYWLVWVSMLFAELGFVLGLGGDVMALWGRPGLKRRMKYGVEFGTPQEVGRSIDLEAQQQRGRGTDNASIYVVPPPPYAHDQAQDNQQDAHGQQDHQHNVASISPSHPAAPAAAIASSEIIFERATATPPLSSPSPSSSSSSSSSSASTTWASPPIGPSSSRPSPPLPVFPPAMFTPTSSSPTSPLPTSTFASWSQESSHFYGGN